MAFWFAYILHAQRLIHDKDVSSSDKPMSEQVVKELVTSPNSVVIGIDPGRINIMYAVLIVFKNYACV